MPETIVNEFTALRNRAKSNRDRTIARARADYNARLVAISTLEQDLLFDAPNWSVNPLDKAGV